MAVLLDGKTLAAKVLAGLKAEIDEKKLSLAAVVVGGNAVIDKFIGQKGKAAGELGVDFRIYDYPPDISTNKLRKRLAVIVHPVRGPRRRRGSPNATSGLASNGVHDADPDGIIIQLPLPSHINTQYILNGVPPQKDVDVLSARAVGDFSVGKSKVLPPVVGAIKALFEEYGIDYRTKYVVVVGAGTLVGKPAAVWLASEKVSFTIVDENTPDISEFTKKADIIISGVGKPGLITGDMVRDGVIIIDCGTSESGGALKGDADFGSVSAKASFITPVPGGIGPLTSAMIFRNLFTLSKKR